MTTGYDVIVLCGGAPGEHAAQLDWLNKGVFVGAGGRRVSGAVYQTYLVQ